MRTPGLPADTTRQFIGFDKDGHAYVLEWWEPSKVAAGFWCGMGYDYVNPRPDGNRTAIGFRATGVREDFIVEHAELPR